MEYKQIRKGSGFKYAVDNYMFSQYCSKGNKKYLKCDGCPCSGYIDATGFTLLKPHTQHADMSREITRLELLQQCRKRAADEPSESLRRIFDEETRNAGEASDTVGFGTIESSMYKRRRKQLPSIPSVAEDLPVKIVGTSYATCMGEEFFRGNVSSDDGGFACLFATETQLNLLKASSDLFMDATFQTVPKQFYQMFTLFVEIDGFIFPTCYVLMTRKTTQMYTAVFTKIKEMLPDFLPHSVQADFEDASVNAFKSVFGMNVAIHGCWFHFAQAIVRKAKKLGLSAAFKHDILSRKCIACVTSLPLLPCDDIPAAVADIELLAETIQDNDKKLLLRRLMSYVRNSWLLKASIGPSRLSVLGSVKRSNNGVESFHSAFKRLVKVVHPNVFAFLEYLKETTVSNMADVRRLQQHKQIRRTKKKANLLNDRRIAACISRYSAGTYTTPIDFLSAVSHCADNVTAALNVEDTSSTEEYDVEDFIEVTAATHTDASNTPAPSVAVTEPTTCDVCLTASRDNICIVPCGHASFCAYCVQVLVSQQGHCPICRGVISTTVRFFN